MKDKNFDGVLHSSLQPEMHYDADDFIVEIDRESNFNSSSESDEDVPASDTSDKPESHLKTFLRKWACDYKVLYVQLALY